MLRWLFNKVEQKEPPGTQKRVGGQRPENLLDQQMERIIAAKAFDEEWYLKTYPDVAKASLPPLAHYLMYGWREGRDPSPSFSTTFYLEKYADVRVVGVNPLFHYVMVGRLQKRVTRPNPNDAPEVIPRIARELDLNFYSKKTGLRFDSAEDAAAHYVKFGAEQGADPHPQFDTAEYVRAHADVRVASVNPYFHYLVAGRAEGRLPRNPSEYSAEYIHERAAVAKEFDAEFYLSKYPDVAQASVDPLHHFLVAGWREARDPSATFSTDFYQFTHEDIRLADLNPFLHYLTEGRKEGRETRQSEGWVPIDIVRATVSPAFDAAFYLLNNPDVRLAQHDPLQHFLYFGWKELRDPTSWFSCRHYLHANDDVAKSGLNPFYHYLAAGGAEGREFRHPGGWKAEWLQKQKPFDARLSEQIAEYAGLNDDRSNAENGVILEALESALAGASGLIISISQDDYTNSVGGVQLCIGLEARAARLRDFVYINLHPTIPIPALCRESDSAEIDVNILCDGTFIGRIDWASLLSIFRKVATQDCETALVIHSLLGHSPEDIVRLHQVIKPAKSIFWLHDYFSLCPSFTLLRNSIDYCGAPSARSTSCAVCVYGVERQEHLSRIDHLFASISFEVVSPSEVALEIWRDASNFSYSCATVLPHCTVVDDSPDEGPRRIEAENSPIRVAFLGHPAAHKGWSTFLKILDSGLDEKEYEFFQLGSGVPGHKSAKFIKVAVSEDDENAMVRALRNEQIDIVLLWSIWPETYSIVAHEALAAGADIICCSQSGNIAALVERTGRGVVYDTEAEMLEALRNGRIRSMVEGRRLAPRPNQILKFGEFSLALLREQAEAGK
jgi:hypothetical protein